MRLLLLVLSLVLVSCGQSGSAVNSADCTKPLYFVSAEVSPPLPKSDVPLSCDQLRPVFAGIKAGSPGT